MRIRRINCARRFAGCFCATLGLALVFLGLIIYLNGPNKGGPAPLEYRDSRTKYIQPNEFVEYPYHPSLLEKVSSLILQVQTNASITAKQEQGIKAYFMNETQYSQLRNDTGFSEEIEALVINLDNVSFEPRSNVTYYIVLTNGANETATVSIEISTFYIIQVFDYDLAFIGLKSALIGGAMFVASFAIGNPFDKMLRKGLKSPIFPGVKVYLSEKGLGTEVAWGGLGIVTLLIVFVVCYALNEVSTLDLPWPLTPLVQDLMIRLGLFFFFASSLVFATLVITSDFGGAVFRNFLYWVFGVRYRRPYNRELSEKLFEIWSKEMVSPLSVIIYVATAILLLGILQYTRDILILLIALLMPLILLFGYNLSVSYQKACKNKKEFEQIRFFIHVSVVNSMVTGALFFVAWFFSWDLFLDTIYAQTIGSSVLVLYAPPLSELLLDFLSYLLSTISILKEGLIALFESFMVATISLFFLLYYFHSPIKTRKAKAKTLLKEIQIFLLTFISVQLILIMSQQSLVVATVTSIVVSLAASFLKFFMSVSWKHILAEPWTCPNPKCKKDLSSFPEDISFCPYCDEPLHSRENDFTRKSLASD